MCMSFCCAKLYAILANPVCHNYQKNEVVGKSCHELLSNLTILKSCQDPIKTKAM